MENLAHRFLTEEEYLEYERKAETKSEYYRGELFAMAGARASHNIILSNLIRDLGNSLRKKPCTVFPSDMRVRVSSTGLYTYPDISIVCEKPIYLDSKEDTLLNPFVILEILSDSTESYDRGAKFQMYRNIPELKEYVLVSTKYKKIESFVRSTDLWVLYESIDSNPFLIQSLGIEISLEDMYEKVEIGNFFKIEREKN
jgi:Uma2 family endonuclease